MKPLVILALVVLTVISLSVQAQIQVPSICTDLDVPVKGGVADEYLEDPFHEEEWDRDAWNQHRLARHEEAKAWIEFVGQYTDMDHTGTCQRL